MNSKVVNQVNDLIMGFKEISEISRVLLHGSSLKEGEVRDIDIVIIFKEEFNFSLADFKLEAVPSLKTLIQRVSLKPLGLDVTYTSDIDLSNKAKWIPFYNSILVNGIEIYNSKK